MQELPANFAHPSDDLLNMIDPVTVLMGEVGTIIQGVGIDDARVYMSLRAKSQDDMPVQQVNTVNNISTPKPDATVKSISGFNDLTLAAIAHTHGKIEKINEKSQSPQN